MGLPKTPDGKVELFAISTGQRFERWPVDARDMLASGAYALDPPTLDTLVAMGDAPATTEVGVGGIAPLPEHLSELTKADLAAFASERFGLALDKDASNKTALLDAIQAAYAAAVAVASPVAS